jgi:hypothetical protein
MDAGRPVIPDRADEIIYDPRLDPTRNVTLPDGRTAMITYPDRTGDGGYTGPDGNAYRSGSGSQLDPGDPGAAPSTGLYTPPDANYSTTGGYEGRSTPDGAAVLSQLPDPARTSMSGSGAQDGAHDPRLHVGAAPGAETAAARATSASSGAGINLPGETDSHGPHRAVGPDHGRGPAEVASASLSHHQGAGAGHPLDPGHGHHAAPLAGQHDAVSAYTRLDATDKSGAHAAVGAAVVRAGLDPSGKAEAHHGAPSAAHHGAAAIQAALDPSHHGKPQADHQTVLPHAASIPHHAQVAAHHAAAIAHHHDAAAAIAHHK